MLLEKADFADLQVLAAHRQHLWEKQRDYVDANSPLHLRAWAHAKVPLRLEELGEFPLINKECTVSRFRTAKRVGAFSK